MGLKLLTGVLLPREPSGEATVFFQPHQVTGDADGDNLIEVGEPGDFKQPPGGFVSLRYFTVQDRNRTVDNSKRIETEAYQIVNGPPTTEQMTIRWHTTSGAEIKEIAYLVVGEA